jgi:all-trans-retinol dehydrogenase (NAD+)
VTQIAGSTILVTGAARGIGRLLALKMARLGGDLVLWDIDAPGLARAADEILSTTGRPARSYVCDVSDRRAVYAAAAKVREEAGVVHVLVNNAGVVSGRPFLDCTDEQIQRSMAVNAMALFWTCKAFLPGMIQAGRGHLVTVASAAGTIGVARLADYCASKWAAVGLDESLRAELRRIAPGVRTTIVCPYFIDTGMFAGVRTRFPPLLPILKEEYVAERIVRAIRRNRRRLLMPRMVGLTPLLRCLPVWLFDRVANLLGINSAMDEFVGHQGPR